LRDQDQKAQFAALPPTLVDSMVEPTHWTPEEVESWIGHVRVAAAEI
jgi:hypothetical protein